MRNIMDRFFYTMKDMRRLTTRYEKLSSNFLEMVHMAKPMNIDYTLIYDLSY
ncbi:MAG: transposase [Magnetovibrio sp.]|nr:transposase [Magnetovibrio sp.]